MNLHLQIRLLMRSYDNLLDANSNERTKRWIIAPRVFRCNADAYAWH